MTANIFGFRTPPYIYLTKSVAEMKIKPISLWLLAYGCIDGIHIKIKRPLDNSQDYFNYKQYFSLNPFATISVHSWKLTVGGQAAYTITSQ